MEKILDVMYVIFYMMSVFLAMNYQSRGAATTAFRAAGKACRSQEEDHVNPPNRHRLAAGAFLAVLAFSATARAHPPTAEAPSAAVNLQGNDQQSWINDPHMHAFYETSRAAFAQGPAKVDVAAFEQKSFAIFRDFGASRHMDPMAMQDHLKLIPRQVVQIVKDDPKVLDSYDNFVAATFGPQ